MGVPFGNCVLPGPYLCVDMFVEADFNFTWSVYPVPRVRVRLIHWSLAILIALLRTGLSPTGCSRPTAVTARRSVRGAIL
jgi:hypothetical protein